MEYADGDIFWVDIVDGGHRAIKYTRLGGVKKEIYSEGTLFSQTFTIVCLLI